MAGIVQSRNAAIDPQVPGPGLPSPAPKKVAMVQAQAVFRILAGGWGTAVELFVVKRPASPGRVIKIFQNVWIKDRRADFVHAGRPLTEVDFAATIAAEREILVLGRDQHAARGAMKELCGFFLRCHRDTATQTLLKLSYGKIMVDVHGSVPAIGLRRLHEL
jgi:hypothetical protein